MTIYLPPQFSEERYSIPRAERRESSPVTVAETALEECESLIKRDFDSKCMRSQKQISEMYTTKTQHFSHRCILIENEKIRDALIARFLPLEEMIKSMGDRYCRYQTLNLQAESYFFNLA